MIYILSEISSCFHDIHIFVVCFLKKYNELYSNFLCYFTGELWPYSMNDEKSDYRYQNKNIYNNQCY